MDESLRELSALSARLGADPSLVQGAGGNSSEKRGDTLWVKASGTWLRDADREPIFVAISLSEARALCRRLGADGDDADWKGLRPLDGGSLAPSIETPLHALLEAPVVFHVHSIRTIAWAVRRDARERLAERLGGLAWSLIPYARPGTPLALAVAEALRESPGAEILVLANHGLVVGGASVAEVEARIADVEARLAEGLPTAPVPAKPDAIEAPAPQGFAWSQEPWAHSAAFAGAALDLAAAGTLYPDHVVFLGPRATVLDGAEAIPERSEAKILFVRGVGTLVREDLTPGALAMAECLGRVLAQLPENAPVRYLGADAEAELLGWDAEKYRGHLDRMRRDAQTT